MFGRPSQQVAVNVRILRKMQDLTAAALSRRLDELGQPIRDTGITRIETGDRRVDVDDLVALAQALGVTVNDLLFGEVTVTIAGGER